MPAAGQLVVETGGTNGRPAIASVDQMSTNVKLLRFVALLNDDWVRSIIGSLVLQVNLLVIKSTSQSIPA